MNGAREHFFLCRSSCTCLTEGEGKVVNSNFIGSHIAGNMITLYQIGIFIILTRKFHSASVVHVYEEGEKCIKYSAHVARLCLHVAFFLVIIRDEEGNVECNKKCSSKDVTREFSLPLREVLTNNFSKWMKRKRQSKTIG